jgi:hypothetical protein
LLPARWLVRRFPDHADVDSFGDDGVPLASILAPALPPMEFELAASDETSEEFLDRASAGRPGSRLAWLVDAFERLPATDALREHLFDVLHAFIAIQPRRTKLSRTFVRGLPAPTFSIGRVVAQRRCRSCRRTAAAAAPAPAWIGGTSSMQGARCWRRWDARPMRSRSRTGGVAWHELGRGVALALYTMEPARRSARFASPSV